MNFFSIHNLKIGPTIALQKKRILPRSHTKRKKGPFLPFFVPLDRERLAVPEPWGFVEEPFS
jgi:hypothetical protein